MPAGEEWDAVASDPEFQKQPESTKNRVAMAFFNQRLAPNIPPEQHDAARNSFFSDAFKAPAPVAEPSTLATAGQAVKETLKAPVPYLAPVADALRTDIPGYIAEKGGQLGFPKTGAAIGTAIGTVGELVPKTGGELAMAGLGGPVLEGAGALGAEVAPTAISKLTRLSVPEVERGISRAKELMNPELLKPETVDNATQAIGNSIKSARSALGRRLGLAEDVAAAKLPGRVISVPHIGDELADNLRKVGYAVDGVGNGDIPKKLPPDLQGIVDKFRNKSSFDILGPDGNPLPRPPRPLSLPDALQLKREIYDMVSYDKSKLLGLGDKESSFLNDAAKNLDDHIRAVGGDELNAATDKFSRMAKGYDKLSKDALSGRVDTVQKRLGRVFRAGDIARKVEDPMATVGAGQKALDTLLDAKTAQGFAHKINPVLERAAVTTGGGMAGAAGFMASRAAVGGPKAIAGAAGLLAATSPALHNALIRAAVIPLGQNAAVEAAASPAARALMASPLLRRLQKSSEGN